MWKAVDIYLSVTQHFWIFIRMMYWIMLYLGILNQTIANGNYLFIETNCKFSSSVCSRMSQMGSRFSRNTIVIKIFIDWPVIISIVVVVYMHTMTTYYINKKGVISVLVISRLFLLRDKQKEYKMIFKSLLPFVASSIFFPQHWPCLLFFRM